PSRVSSRSTASPSGVSSGLPGTPVRARLPPLAAKLALLVGGAAVSDRRLDDVDRRLRRGLLGGSFFGLAQDALCDRVLDDGAVLAPCELRLALLPGREQRGCDEDRGVGTGRDADEEGEREVLQRRAAEEEERGDGQQRDARRHDRPANGLPQ